MKKHKNSKRTNNRQPEGGLVQLRMSCCEGLDGLKNAVAYIPGCLDMDYFDLAVGYLANRAYDEGYRITNLVRWHPVVYNPDKTLTEAEEDELRITASCALADWYDMNEGRAFDAIFTFNAHHDVSVFGYHDRKLPRDLFLGCATHPDNKKEIFKPNSTELKPGVIPAYWIGGGDNDFYKWGVGIYDKGIKVAVSKIEGGFFMTTDKTALPYNENSCFFEGDYLETEEESMFRFTPDQRQNKVMSYMQKYFGLPQQGAERKGKKAFPVLHCEMGGEFRFDELEEAYFGFPFGKPEEHFLIVVNRTGSLVAHGHNQNCFATHYQFLLGYDPE